MFHPKFIQTKTFACQTMNMQYVSILKLLIKNRTPLNKGNQNPDLKDFGLRGSSPPNI